MGNPVGGVASSNYGSARRAPSGSRPSSGPIELSSSPRGEDYLRASARKVCVFPFVFEAVMLEQIGVREELFDDAEGDRLGECLGIGDGDRELQVAVIAAAEAFLD